MIKLPITLAFLTSTLFAGEITIAVAANVSYAMDELKAEFKKSHPETKVNVILGGSGKLTAQIRNGAPYGLFMSADMRYPQALYDDNLTLGAPHVYAQGALAFFSVKPQDFSQGMKLLNSEQIHKIAIANPKTAPYGKAAVEAMQNAKVYDAIKAKFVYGESISQTVSYAVVAADLGIIAKSSLFSSNLSQYKEGVNWASVDPALYTPIKQGVVLLKTSNDQDAYRAFYTFMLSEQAKNILKRYGYTTYE